MADYPSEIPILPIVGSNNYPRSALLNAAYREIEAICTELGTNPKSISDAVAPGATPASVAAFLDMLANIVKNLSGASNWYDAAVPMRRIMGGNGNGGQVAAATTNYVGVFQWLLSATENLTQTVLPIPVTVVKLNVYIGVTAPQPGTGTLVLTLRRNGADTSLVLTIAAGSPAGMYSTTGSVNFFPGEILSLKAVNNAAANSADIRQWTVETNQKG